ncbi:MAG: energy transducer TonB [Crocinitomicaceae bacterium]|nr:energy transducer TonB [Crocinitomicaceae bacterium]MDG1657387.1 energy transducer TonB [Crocinitomicaceae bacterium]
MLTRIGEMNVFIEDNKSHRTSIPAHGTVYVRFVVNPDGSVSHATIARGFYKELDKEALNIISRMPKWIPGEKDGKKVPVYMTVPVTY